LNAIEEAQDTGCLESIENLEAALVVRDDPFRFQECEVL
jgi:hypothetical protein